LARRGPWGRGPPRGPGGGGGVPAAARARLLWRGARSARLSAQRYEGLAQLARQHADLSSAWVCELNRTEELDRAGELAHLARGMASRRQDPEVPGPQDGWAAPLES